MKKLIFLSMVILACSSADDEVSRDPNFVVEGFIVAGDPVNNIKVKGISPLLADSVSSEPVTDAQVLIAAGQQQFDLTYNSMTGLYEYLESDLSIDVGAEYGLEVIIGDRTATATTLVPDPPTGLMMDDSVLVVPPLRLSLTLGDQLGELFFDERILFEWDSVPGRSFYVVIEEQGDLSDPILPEGVPESAVELLSSFRFISEPSASPRFEIIGVALTNYGPHVAKVFSVNQAYIDLFENLTQDSRDLNEPPSNVTNALGIFTSFAVDSMEFEVVRSR